MLESKPGEVFRVESRLRKDELQLVAGARTSGAPAFGLTQIQSRPSGGMSVPLVSTAQAEAPRMDRGDQVRVELQQRLAAGEDHEGAVARSIPFTRNRFGKRLGILETRRRPARRCRRNPYRRSRIPRFARSASRPDQRLQPAKRQKTAARPLCAPSPCSVW